MSAMWIVDCSVEGKRRQKKELVVCDLPRAGGSAQGVAVVARVNKSP
jgi:hypothetical protein